MNRTKKGKKWKKKKPRSYGIVKQIFYERGNYRLVLGKKDTTLLRRVIPFDKHSTYGTIKNFKGDQVARLKKANLRKLFKKYGFTFSKKRKRGKDNA